ncbi:type I-C CRISPR-associated protein Cas7/Csd2 [Desulfomarina profundi]|uniref:Type I-C CRISPR-associated protein Cas7/Csd2 n=1 Tax=Desulfomarina profundi TaxID=2772557 RepID=A0A8D5FMZ0_9BACT|nr:type I-C CRISPR-associated protein Cas7/Csd2 [Desulfomarina profundi]BCL62063.1 type I-C CRISPR-associated protein Cas7/Csd2 [Desulfomarina profundi]
MSEPVNNRYEFVLLFDVKNGNPNGDPDGGNLPRIDPETGHGITTDVCLKRKVRNYVDLVKKNVSPYEIHVREGAFLSEHHRRAHKALDDEKLFIHVPLDLQDELKNYMGYPEGIGFENEGIYLQLCIDTEKAKKAVNKLKDISDAAKAKLKELFVDSKAAVAKKWMCKNFFDVRTFGAVMSTGDKTCGQVRGPVQLAFARSIDPIVGLDVAMFRTAAVRVEEPNDKGLGARKAIVPYGLYRAHGFISAPLAKQTGFSEDDLELFWDALVNMFDHDRSAARGEMAARKLIIFKHDSELGNAPASKLFDLVTVEKICGDTPPRSFADYTVTVGEAPAGVSLVEKI